MPALVDDGLVRANFRRIRAILGPNSQGQVWSMTSPNVGIFRAKFGQYLSVVAQSSPNPGGYASLAQAGRCCPKFGRTWREFDQIGLVRAKCGPDWAKLGRFLLELPVGGKHLAVFQEVACSAMRRPVAASGLYRFLEQPWARKGV